MPTLISSQVGAFLKHRAKVKGNERSVLGAEEKLVILWATTRGWGVAKTARMIGRSASPISRYRRQILDDPQIVFERLHLYSQLADHKWSCHFCGEFKKTRNKIMRHILSHLLPLEIAKAVPLDRVRNRP